jgi:integrase
MPKPLRQERIQCQFFAWRFGAREDTGVYYADGRSNSLNLGRHTLGTRDREAALAALRQLDLVTAVRHGRADAKLLQHLELPSNRISIADGVQRYLKYVARPEVLGGATKSTQKRYMAVFDKFMVFLVGEGISHWDQVTKRTLESYGAWLEAGDYAYRTEFLELMTITQAINWFINEEKVLPATCRPGLNLTKPSSQTTRYCYTDGEVAAIITTCFGDQDLHWLGHVIVGLAYTGLRIGELAQLRWPDVDLEGNTLRIVDNSHAARTDARLVRRTTKTKASRILPLHVELKRVLEGIPHADDGRVYHGPLGGLLKPDTVRNVLIEKVLKPLTKRFPGTGGELSFRDGRLHSLRHFFTSMCSRNGIPQEVVEKWLGHKSSLMTKYYYHLHNQEAQRLMAQIKSVGGAPTAADASEPHVATADQ